MIKVNLLPPMARPYLILVCLTFIGLLFLVANPGYFSHDELQKLDHISTYGFKSYVSAYSKIIPGDEFGVPVRPISFMIQGVLALFMESHPVLVHGFGVLMHALVGCLVFKVIRQLGGDTKFAFTAALIFVFNPMTILATGWSAALMDRLFVLFGLIAFLLTDNYIRSNGGVLALFGAFAFSTFAILSKETALVLPALGLIFLIIDFNLIKRRQFWIGLITLCVPIIIFLLIRLPAIVSSFSSEASGGSYSASFENILPGILVYLSYPFTINLTEAGNWVFVEKPVMLLSLFGHLTLIGMIWYKFSFKIAVSYFFLFFVFIAPVLLIPIKAAHYLYASAIFFSVAIAAILSIGHSMKAASLLNIFKVVSCLMLVVLGLHSINLQKFVYSLGTCMNVASVTTEAAYESSDKPRVIAFSADADAPLHVLHRLYTGRDRIGDINGIDFQIDETDNSDGLKLRMNSSCRVRVFNES